MATSINSLSKKGTRPSIPQVANDLFRTQTIVLDGVYLVFERFLRGKSLAVGALWKYK